MVNNKKQYDNTHSFLVFSLLYTRNRVEICSGSSIPGIGDKIITCNDFVIPRNEFEVSYDVETFPATGTVGLEDEYVSL